MHLNDPTLLRKKVPVAGRWIGCESRETRTIATLQPVGLLDRFPTRRSGNAGSYRCRSDCSEGMGASYRRRACEYPKEWFGLVIENRHDLGMILTLGQGKPLAEAKGEIVYGASLIDWFAEEARRINGETVPGHQPDKRILVLRQPVGVVAAITPWSFPNAMITRKVGPALAAGCAVVLKPAPQTPFSLLPRWKRTSPMRSRKVLK